MSHKFLKCATAVVAVAAAFVASVPGISAEAAGTRKVLNVRAQAQQKDQWCWATTGLTVVEFYGKSKGASQNDFCNAGRGFSQGGQCPNEPAQIYNVQRGLRNYGVGAGYETRAMTFASVQKNIDGGAPIPVGIFWAQGGGHMVDLVGYDSSNQSMFKQDPWPSSPRTEWVSYRYFTSNNSFRWGASIAGITKGGYNFDLFNKKAETVDTKLAPVVETTSVAAGKTLSAASLQAANEGVKSLAQQQGKTTDGIRVNAEATKILQLNPAFVAGTSKVPTVEGESVAAATSGAGDKYVVRYAADGGVAAVATGDEETRALAQANGAAVFLQPQILGFYSLKDGKVTALNEAAKKFINGTTVTVDAYQGMVKARYADKMAGSDYQKKNMFGGI